MRTSPACAEIRLGYPGVVVHREARLVLSHIFDNTRCMIAGLLEACPEAPALRRAVSEFRSCKVAGLAAFARQLAAESSKNP